MRHWYNERMTPLLITLLAHALKRDLPGSRLSHVGQPDGETVVLTLYHPKWRNRHLVMALFPARPFLFLSDRKWAAGKAPSNFVSSLRKNVGYARVAAVEQGPGERIVRLRLDSAEGSFTLAFEALPKYPNLILVGPDGNIVSAHRYKEEVERPVVPGAPYAAPPQPADRPSLWELDAPAMRAAWERDGEPEMPLYFRDRLRGSDPEWVRHLAQAADPFSEAVLLAARAGRGEWGPVLVTEGTNPSLKLFPADPGDPRLVADLHEAARRFYDREHASRGYSQERRKLELEIKRTIKREQRIRLKLKDDRARAEKADQYQWWGELLMAQLHRVPLHAANVELPDVVRGTGGPIAIPLDPGLTPVRNAQGYFHKAQKGERGLELVAKREREVEERIHQLQSALRSLPALNSPAEVRKATRDLFPRAGHKDGPEARKAPPERVPTPNVHREKLAKEVELCAGASAVANEYVTFQLAQPDDLWFHARDYPGAHVVLRRLARTAKFTDEWVMTAARYAARHCKARSGTKVTVSYTEKKHVRRIPGAPTGMVSMTRERSLEIELPKDTAS
jgi:predicted ribosome quality control (RQC) complex YloA/Tae2 family protein